MRILVITSKSLGGSGKYIESLTRGLSKKGYKCDLIYFPSGVSQDDDMESVFDNVFYYNSKPSMSPYSFIRNIFFIRKIIKSNDYDWIHSHTSIGGLYGRIGHAISFDSSRMVHTLHAYGADEFTPIPGKWIYWIIERFLDLFTDKYICPSGFMKEYGKKTKVINYKKCKVVYNSLPLPKLEEQKKLQAINYRNSLGISTDSVVFLFCGRFERQKGVDILIRAFSLIPRSLNAKLIMCGDGEDYNELKELNIKLGNQDRVLWEGWQPDVEKYYYLSDVYVMPSRWESFGLVFLEAMNHSMPVLSTKVQAIPEVVSNGISGILSTSEDFSELSENISLLAKNKEMRISLGKAGKERLESNFRYQDFIDGHSSLYESKK